MSVLSNIVKGLVMSAAPEVDAVALRGANKEQATAFMDQTNVTKRNNSAGASTKPDKPSLSTDLDKITQIDPKDVNDAPKGYYEQEIHGYTPGIHKFNRVSFDQVEFDGEFKATSYDIVAKDADGGKVQHGRFVRGNRETKHSLQWGTPGQKMIDVNCDKCGGTCNKCTGLDSLLTTMDEMDIFDEDSTTFTWVDKDEIEIKDTKTQKKVNFSGFNTISSDNPLSAVVENCSETAQ